jgi:hypothetical protein
MATLFQRPLMGCALGLSGGAAAYSLLARQQYRGTPLRMDSSPNPSNNNNPLSSTFSTYQRDAQTPVVTSHGGLNAKAVRQMTLGSILGMYIPPLPVPTHPPTDRMNRPSLRPHPLPLLQAPRPPPRPRLPRPAHRRKAAQHAHHPLRRNPKVFQRD